MQDLLEERDTLPKQDISAQQDFIVKCQKFLHPNHYVITLTKRWLLPLMCQDASKADISDLRNKSEMLQGLIHLLQTLECGLCKDKGRALFELALVKLAIAKRESSGDYLGQVIQKQILPMLRDVVEILKYNTRLSFEGKINEASKWYVESLEQFLMPNNL